MLRELLAAARIFCCSVIASAHTHNQTDDDVTAVNSEYQQNVYPNPVSLKIFNQQPQVEYYNTHKTTRNKFFVTKLHIFVTTKKTRTKLLAAFFLRSTKDYYY